MDATLIPEKYRLNLERHFGKTVCEKVREGFSKPASVSIRNHSKKGIETSNFEKVAWCENGFLLGDRPVFALDPLFHAGNYYVQDSSSMILSAVLNALPLASKDLFVLDACAAPGGKSSLILDFLDGEGFLVSNEIDGKRNDILEENIVKWGHANVAISRHDTAKLGELTSTFDVIVVDAPCSGEGMFRKDAFAIEQWNQNLINQCATMQENIIVNLTDCLKTEGFLIYCTCTTNKVENEEQVIQLIESGDYELATPNIGSIGDKLIPVHHNESILGYYLLAGISTGEGQFVSVLRKRTNSGVLNVPKKRRISISEAEIDLIEFGSNNEYEGYWTKENQVFGLTGNIEFIQNLPNQFVFRSIGLPILEEEGKKRIPLHGLALDYRTQPHVNLNLEEALSYLRKDSISASNFEGHGWKIVGYENRPLGWVKALQNRVNNYYPIKYRLRLKE
jgi:16S rRNA C967 or C1407 C5-methylase (RsmB/RsmF family)